MQCLRKYKIVILGNPLAACVYNLDGNCCRIAEIPSTVDKKLERIKKRLLVIRIAE